MSPSSPRAHPRAQGSQDARLGPISRRISESWPASTDHIESLASQITRLLPREPASKKKRVVRALLSRRIMDLDASP